MWTLVAYSNPRSMEVDPVTGSFVKPVDFSDKNASFARHSLARIAGCTVLRFALPDSLEEAAREISRIGHGCFGITQATYLEIDGLPVDGLRVQPVITGKINGFSELVDWSRHDWLYPVGSLEMHLHLLAKLDEELDEICVSLTSGNVDEILGEVGDVCWVSSALCVNEGVEFPGFSFEEHDADSDDFSSLRDIALRYFSSHFSSNNVPTTYDELRIFLLDERVSKECIIGVLGHSVDELMKQVRLHRSITKKINSHMLDDAESLQCALQGPKKCDHIPVTAFMGAALSDLVTLCIVISEALGATLTQTLEATRLKHATRMISGEPVTKAPRIG